MDIILKPVITEKMTGISEKLNQYGFIVRKEASKDQIKRAIEELYDVKVTGVSTMRYSGKNRSRFTKSGFIAGRTATYKKAIISVAEGETIDFYSNI
jgi:large subunit ribosomal protein L23